MNVASSAILLSTLLVCCAQLCGWSCPHGVFEDLEFEALSWVNTLLCTALRMDPQTLLCTQCICVFYLCVWAIILSKHFALHSSEDGTVHIVYSVFVCFICVFEALSWVNTTQFAVHSCEGWSPPTEPQTGSSLKVKQTSCMNGWRVHLFWAFSHIHYLLQGEKCN